MRNSKLRFGKYIQLYFKARRTTFSNTIVYYFNIRMFQYFEAYRFSAKHTDSCITYKLLQLEFSKQLLSILC